MKDYLKKEENLMKHLFIAKMQGLKKYCTVKFETVKDKNAGFDVWLPDEGSKGEKFFTYWYAQNEWVERNCKNPEVVKETVEWFKNEYNAEVIYY